MHERLYRSSPTRLISLRSSGVWAQRATASFSISRILSSRSSDHCRLANLDIAPSFLGVAVVTPDKAGPYSGQFPNGLIDPDKINVAPRIGIAWKPRPKGSLLIRTGYGIYYNGSVYSQIANRLASQ